MIIMQAHKLRKEYRQAKSKLEVLKGIDFQVNIGEVVAVVGPSGAGKSTLLHILGGLDEPTGGKVLLDGEDLYRIRDVERARLRNEKIGFIFQFYHLLPEFNALENVMLPALVKGDIKRSEIRKRASSLLAQLGLKNRIRHKPSQLSGGEQQRVAIARALINDPKVVLSDEPTGNLDSANGKEIINLLMLLNELNNQTIVIVTHDESIAQQCHRVVYMNDGLLEGEENKKKGKSMKIYLNGNFVEKDQAVVSVFDHGLLYGDGVFEGIRSYNSLVFKLDEHIGRLYETMHTLMIRCPLSKEGMAQAVVDTLKANNLKDAYIRLIVTRGEGDLGLDPKKCFDKPNVIIITDKITLYPEALYNNGMEIITVSTVRNHPEAINPQLKSLNYLNNILAKIEAGNAGYAEAIMLDHRGFVAECTGDNIFIIKKGEIRTPSQGILKGITRQCVLDIAGELSIPATECLMTRHEVYIADECFLTGTAAEIIPVVKVDGRVIGDGKPGPMTKQIMDKFHTATLTQGTKY